MVGNTNTTDVREALHREYLEHKNNLLKTINEFSMFVNTHCAELASIGIAPSINVVTQGGNYQINIAGDCISPSFYGFQLPGHAGVVAPAHQFSSPLDQHAQSLRAHSAAIETLFGDEPKGKKK